VLSCLRPNPEGDDGGLPSEWEVVADADGIPVAIVCEDCITPEEQQAMDDADMGFIEEVEGVDVEQFDDEAPPHLRVVPPAST
jgi:hypothetical protein